MKTKSYPLHWLVLTLLTAGFVCNFLALILPFWYAKFPQSRNHFLSLGLWEICLFDFMPQSTGNFMYTGCFYLHDVKIRALWPIIFRVWFVVCQVFHTLSFVTFVASETVMLTQAFRIISLRGPRAVFFIIVGCSLTCVFLLIDLITMGVGVDNESKRKKSADSNWLMSLDQCSLSWSYGLSALSFLGSLLVVIILSLFVYPKRSPEKLLALNAWDWPSRSDLLCQPQVNDLRMSRENSRANSSNHSRSLLSTSGGDQLLQATRPLLSVRRPSHSIIVKTKAASKSVSSAEKDEQRSYALHNSRGAKFNEHFTNNKSSNGAHYNMVGLGEVTSEPEVESIDFGHSPSLNMSSYDPRSADTVSLISYERTLVNQADNIRKPSGGTISEQSSIRTLGSSSTRTLSPRGFPTQEDIRSYRRYAGSHRRGQTKGEAHNNVDEDSGNVITDSHLSATTLTIEGAPVPPLTLRSQSKRFVSASAMSGSNPDTSVWSMESAIQAARPMRKHGSASRSTGKIQQTVDEVTEYPTGIEKKQIEPVAPVLVQSAKPMRRRK